MNRFKLHSIVLFVGLLLAFVCPGVAQDENVRGAVKTSDGLLIVWNQPDNNFSIRAKGVRLERVPNQNMAFLFDDKFLQVVAALKADFLTNDQKTQSLDEVAVLNTHRDWESKFLSEKLGKKLDVQSEQIKLSDGKSALIWSFVPPHDAGSVKKQFFLTVVHREAVVFLNGAATATASEQTVRRFLLETIGTLRSSNKPLSQSEAVKLASEKIN